MCGPSSFADKGIDHVRSYPISISTKQVILLCSVSLCVSSIFLVSNTLGNVGPMLFFLWGRIRSNYVVAEFVFSIIKRMFSLPFLLVMLTFLHSHPNYWSHSLWVDHRPRRRS